MFQTRLRAEKIHEPRRWWHRARWRLIEPLVYVSENGERVTVPVGFVTDFASVPRAWLAYALAGDTGHEAAVVHDYLYSQRSEPGGWTRRACDREFYRALLACGEPRWRAWLMWLAVRMFGWLA